jgi:hypothetical protein
MERIIKDVPASIRQRLLNIARDTGRPFGELLQYYTMERFLYRLSVSPVGRKFVLKGALMLVAWKAPVSRPTMDIDLLGRMGNHIEDVESAVRTACVHKVKPDDGLSFDEKSVVGRRIAEDAEYEGVRVRLRGNLGNARIALQIDVGFGDVVSPRPVSVEYPTILDMPRPRLLGYTRESTIAEKYHAMVKLGILNSRMRDFFDIWLLSKQFEYDGENLSIAIRKTFARRGTEVPSNPTALGDSFSRDKAKASQWKSFLMKNRLSTAPEDMGDVIRDLSAFLGPVSKAIAARDMFQGTWHPPGPWIGKRR